MLFESIAGLAAAVQAQGRVPGKAWDRLLGPGQGATEQGFVLTPSGSSKDRAMSSL